jgi:hypothetical protein
MENQKYSYIVYYLTHKKCKNKHHPDIKSKWKKDQITKEVKKYKYELNNEQELTCKIKKEDIKSVLLTSELPEDEKDWIYGTHCRDTNHGKKF